MTCRCDKNGTRVFCVFRPSPHPRTSLSPRAQHPHQSQQRESLYWETDQWRCESCCSSSECARHRLVAFDSHQLGLLLALIELSPGSSSPALQVSSRFNLPFCFLLLSYVCRVELWKRIIGKGAEITPRRRVFLMLTPLQGKHEP